MPSIISQMRNGQSPTLPQNQPQTQWQFNDDYINQIKALMRSKNQSQLLANMAASNPQIRQILQLISNGGNLQVIAQQIAQSRGIDLNTLISKLME